MSAIHRNTVRWNYTPSFRVWYTASILSRDGTRIIWTSGCTTTRPARCDPYSRREVFQALKARLHTLRPGRKVLITRNVA